MTASGDRAQRKHFWTAAALLWLCGATLRLTILAVPPVITAMQADLGLSGTQVGVLSALPVVLFALFALPGSLLVARLGIVPTLAIGLAASAAGAACRGLAPNVVWLYAATMLMGAGIAMMQVALPAAVRQWMPGRIGFATTLYTNGLLVGEILPVALTAPLVLPLLGGSWRWSLALWALPSIPIALALLTLAPRRTAAEIASPARWWPDWSSGLLWRLGLIFTGITATYFAANAFVPGHLAAAGRPDLIGWTLTALNVGQLPASFILLAIASRLERQAWPLVAMGVAALGCVAGLALTASLWSIVFATLFGFFLAGALTLGFALPAMLAAPADVARTSAGMFTIGYALAVAISVIAGAAWDLTGSAALAFVPIGIGVLPLILLPATLRFGTVPARGAG